MEIGSSVGQYFLRVYEHWNRHWLAVVFICLVSGGIITWFPSYFLIEKIDFAEKADLARYVFLGWLAGIICPLIFGFKSLGLVLTVLLIFISGLSVATLSMAIKKEKNDFQ